MDAVPVINSPEAQQHLKLVAHEIELFQRIRLLFDQTQDFETSLSQCRGLDAQVQQLAVRLDTKEGGASIQHAFEGILDKLAAKQWDEAQEAVDAVAKKQFEALSSDAKSAVIGETNGYLAVVEYDLRAPIREAIQKRAAEVVPLLSGIGWEPCVVGKWDKAPETVDDPPAWIGLSRRLHEQQLPANKALEDFYAAIAPTFEVEASELTLSEDGHLVVVTTTGEKEAKGLTFQEALVELGWMVDLSEKVSGRGLQETLQALGLTVRDFEEKIREVKVLPDDASMLVNAGGKIRFTSGSKGWTTIGPVNQVLVDLGWAVAQPVIAEFQSENEESEILPDLVSEEGSDDLDAVGSSSQEPTNVEGELQADDYAAVEVLAQALIEYLNLDDVDVVDKRVSVTQDVNGRVVLWLTDSVTGTITPHPTGLTLEACIAWQRVLNERVPREVVVDAAPGSEVVRSTEGAKLAMALAALLTIGCLCVWHYTPTLYSWYQSGRSPLKA